MPHPLDNPKAGDRWIFSHPRPDGTLFKRDFLLVEELGTGKLIVVMDYLIWSKLEDFDFDASLFKNGKWKKARSGR